MILFADLGDPLWAEAVSHKKFLGGTYLVGKNTIAGRLRDPYEGPLDQWVVEQIFKWVTPSRYVCQFLCK